MRTRLLRALSALAALALAVVRPRSGSTVSFRLNGNGSRFRVGHRVRGELLGRHAPTYRPSNGTFRVQVSRLSVALPARERRLR